MKRVLRDLYTLLQSPEREFEHLLTADGIDNEPGLMEFLIVTDEYFRGGSSKTAHCLADIRGIKLDGSISELDMIYLCSAMIHENFPELMYVDLSGCQLDDGVIQILVEAIKTGHFSKYVSLDMRRCNIDDADAIYLADALKSPNGLEKLSMYLEHNNIKDDGALAVTAALSSSNCPQDILLSIKNNPISKEGMRSSIRQLTPGLMPKHINFAYPLTHDHFDYAYYINKLPQNSKYHAFIEALQVEGTRCNVELDANVLRMENIDKLVENIASSAKKRPTNIELSGYVRPEYAEAFLQKIKEAPYLINLNVKGIDIKGTQKQQQEDLTLIMAQGVSQDRGGSPINRLDGDSMGKIMSYVLPANEADDRMQLSIGVANRIYKSRVQQLMIPSKDSIENDSEIQQSRTL